MNAKARLSFDRQYFELMYSEWLKHRSRYRKVAIPIALLLTGLGLVGAAWLSSSIMTVIVVIVGMADVIETVTYRHRWLTRVFKLKRGNEAEVRFTDSEIHWESDNSHGSICYDAFQSAIATPKSVFLIPSSGASLFIPFATIEPESMVESLVATMLMKVDRGRTANKYVD